MNSLSRLCLAICLCIPLQGCADGALAGAIKMDQAKIWLERVNFKVSKKVNSNAPVDVHLIIIYDDGVMGQVSAMTAEQYFAAEDQLRKDHANDIDIVEWEVVPGQEMESEEYHDVRKPMAREPSFLGGIARPIHIVKDWRMKKK